jgi:hypothetical protein
MSISIVGSRLLLRSSCWPAHWRHSPLSSPIVINGVGSDRFPTNHLCELVTSRPWLRSHFRQRLGQLEGSFSFWRTPKSWSPVA